MKKRMYVVCLAALSVLLASCEAPDYPSDAAARALRASAITDHLGEMDAADRQLTVNAMNSAGAGVNADFMRGFDASMVYALENAGIVYYDEDGMPKDIFAILKNDGINWIRLRIWNEPVYKPTAKEGICDGGNNLAITLKLAKRVKAQGLNFLLDFHYSDRWADPTHQEMPAMWDTLTTQADIEAAIASYTRSVLEALKAAGCAPDMVQLGNEITGGMLLKNHAGSADSPVPGTGAALKAYLGAGAAVVRDVCPNAKIMIHIERAVSKAASFYSSTVSGVDYDVIGLSWYPFYNSHGTLAQFKDCVAALRAAHPEKPVVVAENGYPWTMWNSDDDDYFDAQDDMVWWTGSSSTENAVASLAIDANGTLPSGMNTRVFNDSGTDKTVLDATVKNQALEIRAVIDMAAAGGATGYFYWGGDWVTWGKGQTGAGRIFGNHENQALFGYDHMALPGLKALGAHN